MKLTTSTRFSNTKAVLPSCLIRLPLHNWGQSFTSWQVQNLTTIVWHSPSKRRRVAMQTVEVGRVVPRAKIISLIKALSTRLTQSSHIIVIMIRLCMNLILRRSKGVRIWGPQWWSNTFQISILRGSYCRKSIKIIRENMTFSTCLLTTSTQLMLDMPLWILFIIIWFWISRKNSKEGNGPCSILKRNVILNMGVSKALRTSNNTSMPLASWTKMMKTIGQESLSSITKWIGQLNLRK